VIGRRPSGIVLTGMMRSEAGRRRLVASGIPVVETWDLTRTPIDMVVGFSHERIGESVAQFLYARGRRRPAMVSGDDARAVRRKDGFVRAMRKLGVREVPVEWVPAPTTLAAGRAGLQRLLAAHPEVDAVAASSDLLALGVLMQAQSMGLAVPKRLAIVGLGDLSILAGVTPALTTVRIDANRMGRLAAACIMDRAEGREVPEPIVDVGFTIVERDTA
jgi:LacI family gluconate utilization system Gnt-I transcriptional repressor